ncbi:MAG TPA: hypothetical protein PKD64_18210 [Pirellulaceae bacterium]|nr:hypothetical protein [Pirellulaceae bacterium]HMO94123.1 hypothetical protein [Pirellulaceae bacterium]HMP70839.1 hypothetical protein [Pirellulaceae bacterium]
MIIRSISQTITEHLCRLACWFLLVASVSQAFAQTYDEVLPQDVLRLRNGSKLSGKVTVQDSDSKILYLIELADGTVLTLDSKMVERAIVANDASREYSKRLLQLPDTVDAHWEMQIWCRDNKLLTQREFHLRRIVALDPSHTEAWNLLGYREVDGRWISADHFYESRGYIRHQSKWILPQGVSFIEQKTDNRQSRGDWMQTLKLMRRQYLSNKLLDQEFLAIRDPEAVTAISDLYDSEKDNSAFRRLLIEVLGNIETTTAHRKLISIFLNETDDSNVERALVMLKQPHFDRVVSIRAMYPLFTPGVDTPNHQVQRAGFLVGELSDVGDAVAIRHLIDGLITTHRFVNPDAQSGNMNVGRTTSPFGSGYTFGDNQPKTKTIPIENDSVLRALERLSRQSFGFNQIRWREWYTQYHTLQFVDLRRDE